MNPEPDNMDEVSQYWVDEAEEAMSVLEHLYERGDYSYALFFGHLAIEKMLKGLYVAVKKEHAPPIHNLYRLARMSGMLLTPERKEQLTLITSFNIEARYPDLKRSFRAKCTRQFALEKIQVVKEVMIWLQEANTSKK